MTLKLCQVTPHALTFADGQSLHWADIERVTWQGEMEHWLLHTPAQQWSFKRPTGWLGIQVDAALYALPQSQGFWGSTTTARIPTDVEVWLGQTPQLDLRKWQQMVWAQVLDGVLRGLMWCGLAFGIWLLVHNTKTGLSLLLAMVGVVLCQIVRYYLTSALLKAEERIIMNLSVQPNSIIVTYSTGQTETLSLDHLQAVRILTTSDGPFAPDLYFVLEGTWGVRVIDGGLIDGGLDDCQHLFGLFDRLPNFDHQKSVEAMGSTTTTVFEVWQAPPQGVTV